MRWVECVAQDDDDDDDDDDEKCIQHRLKTGRRKHLRDACKSGKLMLK
jgi:hypothetical protein